MRKPCQGDRTQIAMVGQHAFQPLLPVIAGSAIAFFLVTLSAVFMGDLLGKWTMMERQVLLAWLASAMQQQRRWPRQ